MILVLSCGQPEYDNRWMRDSKDNLYDIIFVCSSELLTVAMDSDDIMI